MKTTALRLYGKRDLRLETFDLPEMQEDEILATVVTDSLCLSSWKEANLGENHKKVPDDVATNPIIIGHEFCGDILAVGKKWQHKFQPGQRYVIQANLQLPDRPDCPGYSFPWVGGEATHVVIPNEVMEQDCLLAYDGETYFEGSLVEPLSCVIGAFNANYHLQEGSYNHTMGIRPQGRTLILGGTGPMGLLAIDYALHGPVNPSLLVITDTDNDKLSYARKHYPSEPQTLIHYLNAADAAFDTLMALSGGHGFDDIFVFVPNEGLVTLASSLLATDGCLNFFAGPTDKNFKVPFNFYNVHYNSTHVVGTSGGSTDDMKEAIALSATGQLQPSFMVTHIGGLDAVPETVLNLPDIPGGKKLIYNGVTMPLTAIADFAEKGKTDPLFKELARLVEKTHGIWNEQAEKYLLAQFGVDIGEAAQ